MTKLIAYFDESGTHDGSPIVAVGGYISTVKHWDEFQREWTQFLSKNSISKFHATDLAGGYKEFSKVNGWSKKRAESALRIADKLIAKHVLYGAVAYTTVADCEKYFPLKDKNGTRKKFSAEYLNSGVMVTNLITNWAEQNGYTEPIRFVFEDGVTGKGYLMQALVWAKKLNGARAHLIGDVSFEYKKNVGDRKGVPQLHTADRLVHLACKSIGKFLIDENSADEGRMQLVKLKLGNVHKLDSENFPLLAQELNLDSEIYE